MKTKIFLAVLVIIVFFLSVVLLSSSFDKSQRYIRGRGVISETRLVVSGNTTKEVEIAKASFRGMVGYDRNGELAGKWDVRFEKVSNIRVDNGLFRGTDISELEFITNEECLGVYPVNATYKIARFRADGRFNGKYGWSTFVWVTTLEENGEKIDSIRIQLYYPPDDVVYDTSKSEGGDFKDDYGVSECADSWRTKVDGGKLQIH